MLSTTYELIDIKAELEDYQVYGYEDKDTSVSAYEQFNSDIENCIDEIKREKFWPIIGETYYASLAALDKSGLSTMQSYLYWAEVYYSVARFAEKKALLDKYHRRAAVDTRTQGNVSSSTHGTIGKNLFSEKYNAKGDWNYSQAGYNIQPRLTRRATIYGN